MRLWYCQIAGPDLVDGDLLTWSTADNQLIRVTRAELAAAIAPLFADDGSGALVSDTAADYVYPD